MSRLDYLEEHPDYYTSSQFGELIGKTRTSIVRLIVEDKIQALRIGPNIIIPKSEYERIISERESKYGRRSV